MINTLNEYQALAAKTDYSERDAKCAIDTTPDNPGLMLKHVLGLAGETGEVVEIVKKHVFHNRPLDREKLLDELGDCLWYLSMLAAAVDMSLSDIAQYNIVKLRARYPEGYSDDKCNSRVDTAKVVPNE